MLKMREIAYAFKLGARQRWGWA